MAPAAGTRPRSSTGPADGRGSQPASATVTDLWRQWRIPLALVALILLGGTVIALLKPAVMITGYLDPAGTDAPGARALADILSDRGDKVVRAVKVGSRAVRNRAASRVAKAARNRAARDRARARLAAKTSPASTATRAQKAAIRSAGLREWSRTMRPKARTARARS